MRAASRHDAVITLRLPYTDRMNALRRSHWLLALALCCSLPTLAATVYKSVDANGVVTYSDVKPPDEILVETLELTVSEPASPDTAAQRLEDMRETTDRMVADRLAREKHRAEIRQLEAQTAASREQEAVADDYEATEVYGGYYPYYPAAHPHRPWRPPYHPPRPDHPIVHPPLSPPSNLAPGVRPLPGNDYPASLIRKSYDPKVRAALR